MVIDKILDRKENKCFRIEDGKIIFTAYEPRQFYNDCMAYGETGHAIAEAMDNGEEEDVKAAIRAYIIAGDYNPAITNYTDSVSWL